MAKVELKTKETGASVSEFINSIENSQQKEDSKAIDKLMQELTGDMPKMWGASIVGYGSETLKYESGRELDWFKIGFSPRKQTMTLYVIKAEEDKYSDLLSKLGKHTVSKGCLYFKKLSDIDENVLRQLIIRSLEM